ncbi:MAG: UvrD-helicase domain-containing protein [Niabella sp.]
MQFQIITMQKPLKILQASAGSGKTFSLTAHYLTLLFSGENKYRDILAVTFTNKATEEMKTRILQVLKGLAEGNTKTDSYRQIILKAHPELTAESLKQKADIIYRKILHDYSRLAVSTIDGFVQKVVRGFAFELGLNADYALELNIEKVKDELIEKLDASLSSNKQLLDWVIQLALEKIKDNKNWNYKKELRNIIGEIFKESFETFEDSLLKFDAPSLAILFNEYVKNTRQEIRHYEETLKTAVDKALTIFNRYNLDKSHFVKGSVNWLWKIEKLLEEDDEKTARILALIDEPNSWFKENKGDLKLYNELNPVLKKIKAFRDEKIETYKLALAFQQNLYYLRLMQEIAWLLTGYRSEKGNLLISDAQKLVTGITDDAGANPSFIWEKVGNRYRNFLFDEFQDTSTRQWKSFKTLLLNALSTASGRQTDHLIVGDVKQSIYRWRSGDWNILHQQAKQDVKPEYVIEDSLEENYRSAKNIIEFNNFLYKKIPELLQHDINSIVNEQSSQTQDWWKQKGFDTIITAVYSGAAQNTAPATPGGGLIKIQAFKGEDSRYYDNQFREDALNIITDEIKILLEKNNYRYKDIAVLVRSNYEAGLCVNRLMEENIPVLSGDALLIAGNPAIDLIINTLKVFTGLDEQTALYKANCIALYHAVHNKEIDPSLYFNLNNKSLSLLHNALPHALCDNWKSWLQLPFAELTEALFDSYELTKIPQHIPYLLAFRDLVGNATRQGEKGIVSFLEWWEEEGSTEALPSPESADAVQIITIHKSKGLAFRAVFVPFCIWDIKPKANSIFWVPAKDSPYHQLGNIPLKFNASLAKSAVAKAYFEELLYGNMDSLNMLYVATTRAIDFLYIATMGQKADAKLLTIGNAVNLAVTALDSGFITNNIYESGTIINTKKTGAGQSVFKLETYPVSGRLSKLYEAEEEKNIVHLLNIERSGRRGSLAHEVLANASDETEVNRYLDKLLSEGTVRQEEAPALKQAIMDVLNDPQISSLFKAADQSIIEKNIIDTGGKLQRPDRILINNDSVVLLDYKFTIEKSSAHEQQILRYKHLLAQMGYKNITSYLFYAIGKELRRVG